MLWVRVLGRSWVGISQGDEHVRERSGGERLNAVMGCVESALEAACESM